MTYNEYVGRVKILDLRIEQQMEKAERLKDLCERVTSIWTQDIRVQSSGNHTRDKRLTELFDSKRDLENLLEQREQAEMEIVSFLNSVLKPDDADLLILKYIYGKTIGDIANQKCYTYSGSATKISRAEAKAKAAYMERSNDE